MSPRHLPRSLVLAAFLAFALGAAGAVRPPNPREGGKSPGLAEPAPGDEEEHGPPPGPSSRPPVPKGRPFSIRVYFGAGEKANEDWSGSVEPRSAVIEEARPYSLTPEDALQGKTAWTLKAVQKRPVFFSSAQLQSPAIEFQGRAQENARLCFSTAQGDFEIDLAALGPGQSAQFLDGEARVLSMPYSINLGDDFEEADYPSIAIGPDGEAWAAWSSFVGDFDEIRIARHSSQRRDWSAFTRVPNTSGDVWMPRVVFDGKGRLWVVWSQQADKNFDLYARSFSGAAWGPLQRLTDHPNPDINHALAPDGKGGFYVVWQAFREPGSDIYLLHFDGETFGKPVRVTDSPANDWYPAVSADEKGAAWVAYDSYRGGSYNVCLRSVENGRVGEEIPVAETPFYETNASVLCAPGGRVFVAYEQGPLNWTKPQGRTISDRKWGTTIYSARDVIVRCRENGQWKMPSQPVRTCLGPVPLSLQRPGLLLDGKGRFWVRFRHQIDSRPAVPSRSAKTRGCWEEAVTYWTGQGWAEAIPLTHSLGRISMFAEAVPDKNGVWEVWPTDNRNLLGNLHEQFHLNVWAAHVEADGEAAPLELVPAVATALPPQARLWDQAKEGRDVAAIRNYAAQINGVPHKIYRGDLHRHTELSWDGGGRSDGSILEFYRYMLDSVDMDFGAITDHQAGSERIYNWWIIQKTSDLYHAPGEFIPLYGYERSASYPNGHRNVFQTQRGVPVVRFNRKADAGKPAAIGGGGLSDDDTKLLYETLRRTGGLAISHTSATRMGTDWRDNDPQLEPVVEIFQGCRTSFEYEGAPRADTPPEEGRESRSGYEPAGFVWNAWNKGYRLGVIASSDHGSTHMSFGMVYSPAMSRQAIFESIQKRQTYGATDNIILDVRSDGGFMGSEYKIRKAPTFQIKAVGTSNIAQLDVIKDAKFVYQQQPNTPQVDLSYTDSDIEPGTHYYYVRLIQDDEEIAWGSPTWVTYEK